MLGNALARINPEKRGIELLDHPLYQVRQGAIRALASRIAERKSDAALIGKIIQAHQDFDPDDLPTYLRLIAERLTRNGWTTCHPPSPTPPSRPSTSPSGTWNMLALRMK